MNVLIITDRRTHSDIESIYPLSIEITESKDFKIVAALSRDNEAQWEEFLNKKEFTARVIDKSFTSKNETVWSSNNHKFKISDFDIALMRIDRPFNDKIAHSINQALQSCLVINSIDGILSTSKKSFLPKITSRHPKMSICNSKIELIEAINQYDVAIIKEDHTFGGRGVFRLKNGQINHENKSIKFDEFLNHLTIDENPYIVQPYMKTIEIIGEKRLLVAGGTLISVVNRIPSLGGWIANIRLGAKAFPSTAAEDEFELIKECDKKLKKFGIFLYSIDTIEDDLGNRVVLEINTLNVGILPTENQRELKKDCRMVVKELIKYITQNNTPQYR